MASCSAGGEFVFESGGLVKLRSESGSRQFFHNEGDVLKSPTDSEPQVSGSETTQHPTLDVSAGSISVVLIIESLVVFPFVSYLVVEKPQTSHLNLEPSVASDRR